jgi:hypothetical protein
MKLDDAQNKKVSAWIAEGLKLSEIQKRLGAECGLNMTYMEVRMLVDDLKLMPKDPPPPKVNKPLSPPPPAVGDALPKAGDSLEENASSASPAPLGGAAKVSVTVDTVARPGALVSGNVTFSDGQSAVWNLDQMGRLGLGPKQPGYKPSAADLQSFQQALEAELSKLGL